MPSKRRARARLYAALLMVDLSALALGFCFANLLRFGNPFAEPGAVFLGAFSPIFVMLAFGWRAYSFDVLEIPRRGIVRALNAFAVTAAVLLLLLFYLKASAEFSRAVFALGTTSGAALLAIGRYWLGHTAGRRHEWNFINEVVLVDGAVYQPRPGQVVVFAEQHGLCSVANDPVSFDRAGRLLANCDRVLLACAPERRTSWMRMLKGAGINVEILMPELDQLGALQLRHEDGKAAILVSTGPLSLRDRLLKRALDLGVAGIALALLSPLIAGMAIAIKLSSPGPVFFRQKRVGQGNCIFEVIKFRTMRTETSDAAGTRSASKDDERITPLGRWLRRTSLDELPQLLNVLKGEMSIVGPRPHALASTAEETLFWHIDRRYWERGAVRPGITGLAQVRGLRGATLKRQDVLDRVQADLEYLSDWTIWRDLRIIFRTARVMVHRNAY